MRKVRHCGTQRERERETERDREREKRDIGGKERDTERD